LPPRSRAFCAERELRSRRAQAPRFSQIRANCAQNAWNSVGGEKNFSPSIRALRDRMPAFNALSTLRYFD
jgi:hypothetical protein